MKRSHQIREILREGYYLVPESIGKGDQLQSCSVLMLNSKGGGVRIDMRCGCQLSSNNKSEEERIKEGGAGNDDDDG